MGSIAATGVALAALASPGCGSSSEPENGPIAARFGRAVYLLEPDGSGRRRFAAVGLAFGLVWSPDGERIAYNDGSDLVVARADGSKPRRVARSAESPSWSPDGERIVFMRMIREICPDLSNPYELFVVDAEGGKPTRLTSNTGYDGGPDWSPDGETIVFEGDDGLFLIRPDGTERQRLTEEYHTNPAWSPDGTLIAFDDFADVHVIAADGGTARRLTRNPGPDFDPDWSPDGRSIAYLSNPVCAGRGGCTAHEPWLIRIMDADGANLRNLTRFGWGPPSWAPRVADG